METFRKVFTVDALAPGRGMTVRLGGDYVAVFNVDGTFHAIDGNCPHMGGLLGNGRLNGCMVTCPIHGLRFDVTTGSPAHGGPALRTYEVKVEGPDVMVLATCL